MFQPSKLFRPGCFTVLFFITTLPLCLGSGSLQQGASKRRVRLGFFLPLLMGQVYRLEGNFFWLKNGETYKSSTEVEYGITSLPRKEVPSKEVLQIRRDYWQIETGLHHRRDVTFREDSTRMTIGSSARTLSIIHNLVLGLIIQAGFSDSAKGGRWFEGHIKEAFSLLTSL